MSRWLLGALSVLAFVGQLAAQGLPGDLAQGQRLAETWCAECHDVAPKANSLDWLEVPPFQALADDPAVTEMALRVFLRMPHQGMPDIRLTSEQTADVITYILSLRGHRQGT